jgi:hypothetical protein
MSGTRKCPGCGAEIDADAPQGLCPACVMKAGLATGSGDVPSPQNKATRADADTFPPAPNPPLSIEDVRRLFPQLEIIEELGRGGMGVVYKARQPQLDRMVALKILPAALAQAPGFSERFTREARALARLSHPNIVAVHDFGQVHAAPSSLDPRPSPLFYFIMEYVDGANVRQMIDAGQITPEAALSIVPKICEALQFAHDEGILHRDIKPENILVDKKGRVKIADFGLAKITGAEQADYTLTSTGMMMGTPRYMAPEQFEHTKSVDHRADIYSLGVVFYEMLTGEIPMGRFAPPSKKVQVDVRLDEVVLRSLEKEPEHRYQHVSEVKTDVENITQHAARAPSPVPRAPAAAQAPGQLRGFWMTPQPPEWVRSVSIPTLIICAIFVVAMIAGSFVEDASPWGRIGNLAGEFWLPVLMITFLALNFRYVIRRNKALAAAHAGGGQDLKPGEAAKAAVDPAASRLVLPPAVAMLVVGALASILGASQFFDWLRATVNEMPSAAHSAPSLIAIAGGILAVLGGIKMLRLQSYGLALAGSIGLIATGGALLSWLVTLAALPVGLWALAVLLSAKVQAAFGLSVTPERLAAAGNVRRQARWPALALLALGLLDCFGGVMFTRNDEIAGGAISMALGLILVAAALAMIRVRGYRLAFAGGILALLPMPPLFVVGIPVGIWVLTTLRRPDVKSAFPSRVGPAPAAGPSPLGIVSLSMAIAGLVLPVLLALGSWRIPVAANWTEGFLILCVVLGFVLELAALVCGIIARKSATGMAGAVISAMGLVLGIVVFLAVFAVRVVPSSSPGAAEVESGGEPETTDVPASKPTGAEQAETLRTFEGGTPTLSPEFKPQGDNTWFVETTTGGTFRLFEIEEPGVEDCTVIYRAMLKPEGLAGRAYLEMWCRLPGRGEFFSKGLDQAVTGSNDWVSCETPFSLKNGEKPELIRLNLVVEGAGRVGIRNVEVRKLTKAATGIGSMVSGLFAARAVIAEDASSYDPQSALYRTFRYRVTGPANQRATFWVECWRNGALDTIMPGLTRGFCEQMPRGKGFDGYLEYKLGDGEKLSPDSAGKLRWDITVESNLRNFTSRGSNSVMRIDKEHSSHSTGEWIANPFSALAMTATSWGKPRKWSIAPGEVATLLILRGGDSVQTASNSEDENFAKKHKICLMLKARFDPVPASELHDWASTTALSSYDVAKLQTGVRPAAVVTPVKTAEKSETASKAIADVGWMSLFDGKDLGRWRVIEDPALTEQHPGKVRVKDGQMVFGEEGGRTVAGVGWTGAFPEMDYEVEWEWMSQNVKDTELRLMFPVGKDLPALGIRGEVIEGKFGPVNGEHMEIHGAANQPPLLDGRWYTFRIRVSQAGGLGVWVDGHEVVSHRVAGYRFGMVMPDRPGVPKSLALGMEGPSVAAVRNIRMRRLPPSAAAKPSDLSPSEARSLIPEAASMSFVDFQKLAGAQAAPSATAFESLPLSLVLLSMRPGEAAKEDFRYLGEAIPPPALAHAVSLGQARGYATLIQPDFITDCTCSASEGAATGVVSFRAEGLYSGKVEFLARWNNGAWQIDEFRLPGCGIKTIRGPDGKWTKCDMQSK